MIYNLYPHEFWLKVDQYMVKYPGMMRYGQCVSNMLSKYKHDHYLHIVGTDLDPFYDDSRVPALSEWLARHWLDTF